MSLMYTELSDMGADMPPMAPFAVRESSLAIGRSSGPENRGGYTQPEERIGIKRIVPNDADHDHDSGSSGANGAVGAQGANGASIRPSGTINGPQGSSCSLGSHGQFGGLSPVGPLGPLGPLGQLGQLGQLGPLGQLGHLGRGAIAPVSPMISLGANIPLAVFVVLVLNALMMLLCAVALLSRGGRSA